MILMAWERALLLAALARSRAAQRVAMRSGRKWRVRENRAPRKPGSGGFAENRKRYRRTGRAGAARKKRTDAS